MADNFNVLDHWAVSATTVTATGEVAGTDFSSTGLTGATTAVRFVGGTTSGAPASGTFSVGDFVITQAGQIFICVTAGSPGTWIASAAGTTGIPTTLDPIYVRGSDFNSLAANEGWYWRTPHGGTISKIALEVTASSGNISLAAYRNSGSGQSAVPGTRLATSGAVACPSIGYAETSLGGSVVLNPGDWLALSADNATAAFRSVLSGTLTSNLGAGRVYFQAAGHPLPNPAASLSARTGKNILLVGVA